MKNFKNKLYDEKGIISSIVLTTLLFFIIILTSLYKTNANRRTAQLKSQLIIKDLYEKEYNEGNLLIGYKAEINKKSLATGTINGEIATSTNPVIPKGFIPINTDTSNWGNGDNEPVLNDLNNGLVITDSLENGNEFVWVPVEKPSDLYDVINDKILVEGKEIFINKCTKSKIVGNLNRNKPSSKEPREPAILLDSVHGDLNTENINKLGFTSAYEMAQSFINDYNNMIESLEKYKGFYIGRYELSSEGSKKNKPVGGLNWYELYNITKNMSDQNSNIATRIIWGLNWDRTCKWLEETRTNINDSTGYGNYGTSQINTGSNENYKKNNIYDLAGNAREVTQEGGTRINEDGSEGCVRLYRGGDYTDSPTTHSVIYRTEWGTLPDYKKDKTASRAILYVY